MKGKEKRMTLTFNEKAYKMLEELTKETGKSKAEVIRTALSVLNYAEHMKKENNEDLALVSGDQIVQKILIA